MITGKLNGSVLTIFAKGRIDSTNAAEVQAAANEIIGEYKPSNIILDLDELQYISSAGLRVVLNLRKAFAGMEITNASSEVYDIFDMTGFTEMIPVGKAYRKLSVDGCEAIGQGANGKVYRLDPDTIIKVYINPDSLPDIHRERELARRAFVLGIPTAIPYDVVRVDGSYGSVFELLSAKSFGKLIAAEPENIDKYVGMYVELLKKIHSTEVRPEDMPDMKAVCLDWADFLKDYLPSEKWEKLHSLIDAVPESHMMMHGDYHIKNVMLQNGEALLIDMDTLAQGDPVFEFASIYNAYQGFAALDHSVVLGFLGLDYETTTYIWRKTLELYFDTTDETRLTEIENKSKLLGFTRLARRLIRRKGLEDPEAKKLIDFYLEQICELLDGIDRLTF